MTNSWLITGGAGFIGSHFVKQALNATDAELTVLDKLTYAGDLTRLADVQQNTRLQFVQGDINNIKLVDEIMLQKKISHIINFAAATHVDRSISAPQDFIDSNINGVYTLLEAARKNWPAGDPAYRFLQISTDEVFGSLTAEQTPTTEQSPYQPSSPYSASKAAADHLVMAWHKTYDLPVNISYCSNNFGAWQFPEKLIPLSINNALNNLPISIYGDGNQIRDWLHVDDHCNALLMILSDAPVSETYNISANNEWRNINLVRKIVDFIEQELHFPCGSIQHLIQFVTDRPGHDQRYAMNSSKIKSSLTWQTTAPFLTQLQKSVSWYSKHQEWLTNKNKKGPST